MAGFAGSDAGAVDDFGNAGEDGLADSEDIGADGAVGDATADLADGAAGCGAASGGSSSTKKSSWRIDAGAGGASRSLATRHNRQAASPCRTHDSTAAHHASARPRGAAGPPCKASVPTEDITTTLASNPPFCGPGARPKPAAA